VVSANTNLANNLDTQAFYDAGVPEEITVELTAGPEASGNRADAFTSALSAEQPNPDLMMMDNGWTVPFIVQESIMNLESELDESFVSTVKENSFDMLVRTGSHPRTDEMWALPYFPDFPTIQYRKDLMRQAGYTDSDFSEWETNPLSWSEFTTAVSEAHEAAAVDYGYLWQGSNYVGLSCCSFNELLTQSGGAYFGGQENLFGPVGDRPITVDEQEAIDAVKLGRDLIYDTDESPYNVEGVSPEETTGWTEPDVDAQFADKPNAVAMRNWTYTVGIAQNTFEGTDAELGVMPMPKGPNGSWAALGGWLMAVNPHTDNKAASLEVLKAFHSDEVQMATLNGPGFLPHQPGLFEGEATEHPVYGDFMNTLGYASENAIARPVTPVWSQQTDAVSTEVNAALRKTKTPQEAMGTLAEKLQDLEDIA
jgi:ABC-type glycerol-3-phosphate transport system substrate-binding protein